MNTEELIAHTVKMTMGMMMTHEEYQWVYDAIAQRAPQRLLVWGRGRDSQLWLRANEGGVTVFIEDQAQWADEATVLVKYTTQLRQSAELAELYSRGRTERLELALPPNVRAEPWDTVLVDAPWAWDLSCPGRMQSIYETARLIAEGGTVIVHDADRPAERLWTELCLGVNYRDHLRLRIYEGVKTATVTRDIPGPAA